MSGMNTFHTANDNVEWAGVTAIVRRGHGARTTRHLEIGINKHTV